MADTSYDVDPVLPELYDHVPAYNSRTDIGFYSGLCRDAGEAIELGCGTGRILIPAARAGCRIVGLDGSQNMLARCRAKADSLPADVRERVALVKGNLTSFHLPRKYPLAIAPFRPIQHLTAMGEQIAFLECVRAHLEPGGRLVFDVFRPNLAMLAAPIKPEEIEDTPERTLPDGRRFRRAYRIVRQRYAEQASDIEMVWYVDGRRIVQSFAMRYFFRFEVEHLLARCGFAITAFYGDFDGSPFGDESVEMIFTAKRAG